MKRRTVKSGEFKTKHTTITVKPHNGHVKVSVKHRRDGLRFQVTTLTSVTSDIQDWEYRTVMVHVYKELEDVLRTVVSPKPSRALKYRLKHTNYAEVFGSPWN